MMVSATFLALVTGQASAKAFDGVYVGGGVGHATQTAKYDISGTLTKIGRSKSAAPVQVYTGVNAQLTDNFVIGAELGITPNPIKASGRSGTTTYTSKTGSEFDISGRAGFLAGENTLIYARAGVAKARLERTALPDGGSLTQTRKNLSGSLYGVGAEVMVSEKFSVRGELTEVKGGKDLKRDSFMLTGAYHF